MRRGPKPSEKVKIKWTPRFAYVIGLIVSDGCLSKDGRHIVMTSKDREQLHAFNACLDIDTKICKKYSGSGNLSYYVQFSDVLFYRFLLKIGVTPAKSKTISDVKIPRRYFFDFLRGYFDGDGCSFSYYDKVFTESYRFYISFASGSRKYIDWLRNKLNIYADIKGSVSRKRGSSNVQLRYSKKEAGIIARKMYYHKALVCLERKRSKVLRSLEEIEKMSEW